MTFTLRAIPPGAGGLAPPYITLSGNSIVAVTPLSISLCYNYTARGQASAGLLVLSIVETEANRVCSPEQTDIVGATIAAADVASGLRTVSLVDRVVRLDGSAHESVLAQADINVP
ncbi:MAG TPA: hypothetical protein VGH98_05925 [Gemmatimonadaceae bacterium]